MNITLHSIASQSVSLFKEKIVPFVTAQQEKIAAVAAFALGCLALYLLSRCFRRKRSLGNLAKADVSTSVITAKTDTSASVTTWNFRKDSKNEAPETIPNEYEWVPGSDLRAFLVTYSHSIICAVAKAAFHVPNPDNPDKMLISDLIINAPECQTMQVMVKAVADDKDKLRVIFSSLFAARSRDSSFNVGEKLQWVVGALSDDQLTNVLALGNRHGEESDLYQRDVYEMTYMIEVHEYLRYRDRAAFPKTFIDECDKLSKYNQYAGLQIAKQSRKLSAAREMKAFE